MGLADQGISALLDKGLLLIYAVKIIHVTGNNFDHVVIVARYSEEIDHIINGQHGFAKTIKPVCRVMSCPDHCENS